MPTRGSHSFKPVHPPAVALRLPQQMSDTTLAPAAHDGPALSRALLLALCCCCGLAVANIYYNQPMLGLISAELHVSGAAVAASTQAGYALGLLVLVPLGDRLERRRMLLWQTFFLVLALAAAALAPSGATLVAASIAIGFTATTAQLLIPLAAAMALPTERGRVVGSLMSGVLAGILLARTLSGLVAAAAGWRAMFWLGAGLAALMAGLLARCLPRVAPTSSLSFPALMQSLVVIYARQPALRRAAFTQACLFAAFSAFWSILALHLAAAPPHLGAAAAGLFGLVGLAGVAAAPIAGRSADRFGLPAVGRIGILIVIAAFALLLAAPGLFWLGVGVVLMDAGVQTAMVSNQTTILSLSEGEASRLNTLYVVTMFVGGAMGSALGGLAWAWAGWPGVMELAICLGVLALLIHSAGRKALLF